VIMYLLVTNDTNAAMLRVFPVNFGVKSVISSSAPNFR